MIKRLKYILNNNSNIIENFSFLSVLQITNFVIFLLLIPYLYRVLGKENYGLVVFAQTVSQYLIILINFGLNATATRDISIYRDDGKVRSQIISSIISLKFLLFILSFFILLILIFFIPFIKQHKLVFIFSMVYCLNEALFPIWYFQGIEKMKYITYLNIGSRIISLFFIFIIINEPSKYLFVPLILGIGNLIGAIIGLILVFKKADNYFIIQPLSKLKSYVVNNFPLFISNVSSQMYVNANRLIIGSYLSMSDLAIYDVADRVVNILKVPLSVISQVLFPKVSRDGNVKFILKSMVISTMSYVIIYFILFISANIIIELLTGTVNLQAVRIMKLLGLSIIPICAGMFYSDILLLSKGLFKSYAKLRIVSLLLYVLLVLSMIILKYVDLIPLAISIIIVESFVFAYSFYLVQYVNKVK